MNECGRRCGHGEERSVRGREWRASDEAGGKGNVRIEDQRVRLDR
jgi:hypothetical protein